MNSRLHRSTGSTNFREPDHASRQTTDPSAWNTKFKHELSAAVDEIRRKRFTDIRIEGAFRLSTGFAAGAAAPRVAGLTVAFRDWSSNGESTEFPVAVTEHHVGDGGELAVALCVTSHIEGDVLEYIQANSLPVAKLIEIAPGSGVGQTSIPGDAEALGFVFAAFDEIRRSARSAAKLHPFQSAPNGIGILLGHLWNRVPVTQLYDDANSPEGYLPTFTLASYPVRRRTEGARQRCRASEVRKTWMSCGTSGLV